MVDGVYVKAFAEAVLVVIGALSDGSKVVLSEAGLSHSSGTSETGEWVVRNWW